MWQTSNPAIRNGDAFEQFYSRDMFASRPTTATLAGVVNKTAILVGTAAAAGTLGYWLFFNTTTSILLISSLVSLIVCFGVGYVLCGKPELARYLAMPYAVVEGVFLGAFTALADAILAARGLSVALGSVGVQAFIITLCVFVAMLVAYRAGIIRPTRMLKAVVVTASGGIMLAYLVSFVLSLFWQPLPLISVFSAVNDSGWMGLLGLGINVFILGVAALWLVIDFGEIEQRLASGAAPAIEWYCGFALLVTLAWIYYESVKLVLRVASLFGNRN